MVTGLCVAASAQQWHPTVVDDDPADTTPHVAADDSGKQPRVLALAKRRGVVYAGGLFRKVQSPLRRITKDRHNVAAFQAATGAFTSFAPKVNGPVWSVRTSPSAVYIGGEFTEVNGVPRHGLAKLDPVTGAVDPSFKPPFRKGRVTDLALVRGRLIAGGTFPRKLVALRPDTGRLTDYLEPRIEGNTVADGSLRPGVFRFAVSPNGTRLVAVGNFTHVNGKQRARAFMFNLGESRVRLSSWWYPPLADRCRATGATRQAYLQDVDFAPGGGYFVFVSTGFVPQYDSQIGTHLCDAAARFETDVMSPSEPTWINYTGGDTLHSVAVTGAAVYVQGHSRWLNNPYGADYAGPGAVERKGGGAIDPDDGTALSWNPVMANKVGGYAFLATADGLWIGRDGKRIGGEYHRGIAYLPLP
jgi:hypothetical protein